MDLNNELKDILNPGKPHFWFGTCKKLIVRYFRQ